MDLLFWDYFFSTWGVLKYLLSLNPGNNRSLFCLTTQENARLTTLSSLALHPSSTSHGSPQPHAWQQAHRELERLPCSAYPSSPPHTLALQWEVNHLQSPLKLHSSYFPTHFTHPIFFTPRVLSFSHVCLIMTISSTKSSLMALSA